MTKKYYGYTIGIKKEILQEAKDDLAPINERDMRTAKNDLDKLLKALRKATDLMEEAEDSASKINRPETRKSTGSILKEFGRLLGGIQTAESSTDRIEFQLTKLWLDHLDRIKKAKARK